MWCSLKSMWWSGTMCILLRSLAPMPTHSWYHPPGCAIPFPGVRIYYMIDASCQLQCPGFTQWPPAPKIGFAQVSLLEDALHHPKRSYFLNVNRRGASPKVPTMLKYCLMSYVSRICCCHQLVFVAGFSHKLSGFLTGSGAVAIFGALHRSILLREPSSYLNGSTGSDWFTIHS
jgi:hypothetical protein